MLAMRTGQAVDTLIGRGNEDAAFGSALRDVASGSGRVIVVRGEAGIGKTSVLNLAATRAEAGGMSVLRTRGEQLERDVEDPFARRGGRSSGLLRRCAHRHIVYPTMLT